MTILVQVMDSCSVEGGRSSNDPMDLSLVLFVLSVGPSTCELGGEDCKTTKKEHGIKRTA
jgi:hypothetical protein